MNCRGKSTIKLTSNIMLKSKYDKNPTWYTSFALISFWAKDVGLERFLSKQQVTQKYKRLFYAEKVHDVTHRRFDSEEYNDCDNCVDRDICW